MSKQRTPPKIAQLLLSVFIRSSEKRTIISDLDEFYAIVLEDRNRVYSDIWYWIQAVKTVFYLLRHSVTWSMYMFSNYLKVAFRNLLKHRMYSMLNISGLAVGFALFLLTVLYADFNFSFDKFHANYDRMYVVAQVFTTGNSSERNSLYTPAPLKQVLLQERIIVTVKFSCGKSCGFFTAEKPGFY